MRIRLVNNRRRLSISISLVVTFSVSTVTCFTPVTNHHHHHGRDAFFSFLRSSCRSSLPLFLSSSSSSSSTVEEQFLPDELVNNNYNSDPLFTPLRCVKGVAAKTGALNEAVSGLAGVSLNKANELINIGAVWARMECVSQDDVMGQYNDDTSTGSSATSIQYADLPKGNKKKLTQDLDLYVEKMQQQRFRRILTPSIVPQGTDLRIYPQPRRFPACYNISENNILYEDTTFLVVDKPPMLPTQPDTSNYFECCPGCVSELLGPFEDVQGNTIARPLLCHRVDSCVGGCVVMSKDGKGQAVFSEMQRLRKLKKVYLAVTNKPVPEGLHVCWFWKPSNLRGKTGGPPCQLVSFTPPESRRKSRQFWIRCVLEVTKCEPISIDKNNPYGYDPSDKPHFQSTIRLVTGRKHQVRAQLASLGCPIIRDTLYEPIAGYTLDSLQNPELEEEVDAALQKCSIPTQPIGLQAHAILFAGIRAKAKTPWWGDGAVNAK